MSTIVEALGANPGVSIVEALGGNPGETIADAIEAHSEPVVKYTVSFNANGGTGSINQIKVNAGGSVTLPDGSAYTAPEEKTFLGWAETALAQAPTVESPFTPDEDTELFAVWGDSEPVVTTFTVNYNANGGTGTILSDTVNEGSSITLPDGSTLTPPEGKEFLGWAKSASAQSATVESPFTPDEDIELFAVWGDA